MWIPQLKNGKKVLILVVHLVIFLTGLSKAFGCISQEQLIAKLHMYGSDKRSLVLIYN